MATSAAERTEAVVTQASTALQRASEETKKAVVEAGQTARDTFGRSVEAARGELSTQLSVLLGGEEPELLLRLQPVLDRSVVRWSSGAPASCRLSSKRWPGSSTRPTRRRPWPSR